MLKKIPCCLVFYMRSKSGSSSEPWKFWGKRVGEMNRDALKMHRWDFEPSAFNNGILSGKWGLRGWGEHSIIESAVCPCFIKMGTPMVTVMETLSSLPCIPLASHFVLSHVEIFSHVQPPKLGRFDFSQVAPLFHTTYTWPLTFPTVGHSGKPPGSLQPQPLGCFQP